MFVHFKTMLRLGHLRPLRMCARTDVRVPRNVGRSRRQSTRSGDDKDPPQHAYELRLTKSAPRPPPHPPILHALPHGRGRGRLDNAVTGACWCATIVVSASVTTRNIDAVLADLESKKRWTSQSCPNNHTTAGQRRQYQYLEWGR